MATERDRRREAYVGKVRAELSGLATHGVHMGGNAFSAVVLAKGELSPEERDGAELLSGPDGVALRKSLAKLGYEPEDWCTLFLPAPGSEGALAASLVREALTALDPATLVCCDSAAAQAVRDAYADDLANMHSFQEAMLEPGYVVYVRGVRVLALGGFANALGSSRQKQVMWARLKQISPLGEPF
ncbi:hypothetical protein [Olsenella sp. Marseille-P4559]|uniref:hypothetical protein n=1 Tax=Olsenella sp. Marseille-P4559 TaxID=2364795 RepID=UPI001030FCBB|nr:hypothetical protein [Olsenella sp. Marseille-P4559]